VKTDVRRERTLRILVVDDGLDMAEMVVDGLVDHGFEARAIATAKEAIEQLSLGSHDALAEWHPIAR
jgi:DNA-binding response OmpR family regulator